MTRDALVCVVILLFAGLGGCFQQSPPASSKAPESQPASSAAPPTATPTPASTPPSAPPAAPATPAGTAVKTEDTNVSGVVADITECSRKDGVLSIKVRLRNTGSERKNLNLIENRDYEKYYVSAANKKYFILKDSEGTYLTPQASGTGSLFVNLEPNAQYTWWAKYPAPPAEAKTVTIYMKLAAPFEDVPVADQ